MEVSNLLKETDLHIRKSETEPVYIYQTNADTETFKANTCNKTNDCSNMQQVPVIYQLKIRT